MKRLKKAMVKRETINQTPALFIKDRCISWHKFNKKNSCIKPEDLPIETAIGSSYLIKNSNIIEIYCWCDPSYSTYLQIAVRQPSWLGKVNIVNIEPNDPECLEFLLSGYDIFYSCDNIQYLISNFINSGFLLYLKNS
jgi:hypothetical protein